MNQVIMKEQNIEVTIFAPCVFQVIHVILANLETCYSQITFKIDRILEYYETISNFNFLFLLFGHYLMIILQVHHTGCLRTVVFIGKRKGSQDFQFRYGKPRF